MPAPQGRTVRNQLEAWRDSQSVEKRPSAFRRAGLQDLYETIVTEGELSAKVQCSLRSPKTRNRLLQIGIDTETTWVDMAKAAADPTRDWFPSVTTRGDVVDLMRPYVERIGSRQLSRVFFDGKEIETFFRASRVGRLPAFEMLVELLRFCVEDERTDGLCKTWSATTILFVEGQWNVFGRGKEPFPELTGEKEFNAWFAQHVPHERIDHVAKMLNEVLGEVIFSTGLLISWRKGRIPSLDKLEALLRGIKLAFPEWLPREFRDNHQETNPAPCVPAPQDLPAQEESPVPMKIPRLFTQALKELAELSLPSKEEQQAARDRTAARLLLEEAEQKLMDGIQARLTSLQALIPELESAERRFRRRTRFAQAVPSAGESEAHNDDPGEVVNGLRFVLTAVSFQRASVFNLDEVEDTANLIGELARRLALLNSMTALDKRAVLKLLRHAFDELFVQVRHTDAQQEDLPAMFLEMKMTAAALTGADLDDIKS